MSDVKTLYDEDFLAWSIDQAGALRAAARTASNQKLDWENLAEEIESLGTSQKLALHSQMRRIVHHLLKLEFSPATEPRRGWMELIDDARSEIEDLLQTSPSLKNEAGAGLELATRHGARKVTRDLENMANSMRRRAPASRQPPIPRNKSLAIGFHLSPAPSGKSHERIGGDICRRRPYI
jgi:hypothetical protein